MTVGEIIKAVRWCIDEEANNAAEIADVSAFDFDNGTHTDMGMMNNIIRNKIPDALRWVFLYAPVEHLTNVVGSDDPTILYIDVVCEETITTPALIPAGTGNTLDTQEELVRLIRVKGNKWYRAILGDSLIMEDSDEYLQLRDSSGAIATDDRPQAALINTKEKKIEVWPYAGDTFTITYIRPFNSQDFANLNVDSTIVGVPTPVETSFIYYLAYLLLTAYGDTRAKNMYEVAVSGLGRNNNK